MTEVAHQPIAASLPRELAPFEPQARQRLVLSCPCDEILYGGAAGAGKSWTLLADFCHHAIAAEAEGKSSKGVLFRQTFRELDELIREGRDMYTPLGWKFWRDRMEWESPHGSFLKLAFLASMEDAHSHHGFEYDWEGFDELTLWGTPDEYNYLGTRLRSKQGVKLRVVTTSNPDGPGHTWVKHHFQIDRYPQGMTPLVEEITLTDGRVIEKSRIFIPGKLKDNIYLAADGRYEAQLRTRPPHIQKMLLDGRWDVVEGAFFREWDPDFHIVAPFILPLEWTRWMSMDWGSVHPYAILWFAMSPSGEIYIYRELYGDGSALFPGRSNVGTRETAKQVANRITQLEDMSNESILERYVDSQVWQQMGHQVTIGDEFRTNGVVLQSAAKLNKAHSINLLRQSLQITNGMCQLKIFRSCVHVLRQIPAATICQSDANVYDPKGETHALDALLYGLRKNNAAESLKRSDLAARLNTRRASAYGKYGVQ